MGYTYILHSKSLDKFYVGACHKDLDLRIENHNFGKYGSKTYTSQTDDWILYLKFDCEDYSHAIRLERKIKSMKSKKYIENLLKYLELRDKIFRETTGESKSPDSPDSYRDCFEPRCDHNF